MAFEHETHWQDVVDSDSVAGHQSRGEDAGSTSLTSVVLGSDDELTWACLPELLLEKVQLLFIE